MEIQLKYKVYNYFNLSVRVITQFINYFFDLTSKLILYFLYFSKILKIINHVAVTIFKIIRIIEFNFFTISIENYILKMFYTFSLF